MRVTVILALALATPAYAAPPQTVERVHDGDTFRLAAKWGPYALQFSVRLLASEGGIDTPEIGAKAQCAAEQDAAIKAREFAKAAIAASGNLVWLERVEHDRNGGRILADALVKVGKRKQSLGDMLIEAGHAVRYNGTGPRQDWCAPGNLIPLI